MILTLQTNTFGWHGGIPGYNRLVCRVLNSIDCPQINRVLIAMDDPQAVAVESSALTNLDISAFAGKRSAFVKAALSMATRETFDLVLAGHVNYAPLCVLLKLLRPQMRFGVFVYGCEVWEKMPLLRRWSVQQADFVISISDYTKSQAVQINGLRKERIFILPNALEWTNYVSAASVNHSLPEGTKLLSVGRLDSNEQRKGFDTVIESLPAVIKQIPDVQYLIVGVGSDLERHKVLASTVGVSDRVHFLGAVDEALLQDCYRSCDLFVMPSAQEGFGFVYLEAMQYHKAVVAASSGGAPEVVEDNITGRLVEYGNKEHLARTIIDLLTDSDLRRQFGNAGHQKLQEKFTFPQFRETLSEILRRELPPEKAANARFAPLSANANNQGIGVAGEDELASFGPGTAPPQSDSFRKGTCAPLAEADKSTF